MFRDQSPMWHEGIQEFEGKIQLASNSSGAGVPSKASFLRGQPARHLSALSRVPWTWKALVWTGCLCEALGESSESQALSFLLRHTPLYFTPQEANWP